MPATNSERSSDVLPAFGWFRVERQPAWLRGAVPGDVVQLLVGMLHIPDFLEPSIGPAPAERLVEAVRLGYLVPVVAPSSEAVLAGVVKELDRQ